MAQIAPFKGLRPKPELVSRVAVLPYDVVDTEEARRIAEGNRFSFFHVSKPEIDFPQGTDLHDPKVYRYGKEYLSGMIREGIMRIDEKPCYYCYTQIMDGREQTGFIACVSIDDYLQNRVKRHELTRQDKEDDRTNHTDIINANTGQVFLFYKDNDSKQALREEVLRLEPVYDFISEDGVRHIVRVIGDERLIQALTASFEDDILYIADGHHRAAAAVRVGMKRREQAIKYDGSEEFNRFMAVLFPHRQLKILAYNRVVRDLNGMSTEAFLEAVQKKFSLEVTGRNEPEQVHEFCMFCAGKWYLLKPIFEMSRHPVASLDVSVLQEHLLKPILGIQDPRTDPRIDFVGGKGSASEIQRRVERGDYAVAFSLYPTTIEQLMNVADENGIMPPKSTWFEPKLRCGIVVHLL